MFHTDRPGQPARPAARLIRCCEAAEARLEPLLTIVQPLARTRPDAAVPTDLLVLARQALRPIGPVARHLEAPALLPLHHPVTYASLAARLALAAQLAQIFCRRHDLPEDRLQAITWQVEDQVLALSASSSSDRKFPPQTPAPPGLSARISPT